MSLWVSIVAAVAVLMLLGQFFAGTSDYYLAIENPRPLDDNLIEIRILGWGFASETSRSRPFNCGSYTSTSGVLAFTSPSMTSEGFA